MVPDKAKRAKPQESRSCSGRGDDMRGRHNCGNGFSGRLIEAKGIMFCGLCGSERKL